MKHNELKTKKGYVGFEIQPQSRSEILKKFPPKFPKVFAHHITYQFGVSATATPDQPSKIEVVGYASGSGIEALVIEVDGKNVRPDGGVFHMTLSLDPSFRKPKDSNDLLSSGWDKINPFRIDATSKFFAFG